MAETKAERALREAREAEALGAPLATAEEVRDLEQAVLDKGRRPEDVEPDLEAERDRQRAAGAEYNPDGEWLAPVDSNGKMLVSETGEPLVV